MKMLRAILGLLRARRLAVLVLAASILLPVFFAPRIVLSGGTFSYLFVIDVSESMNVRDVDARNPERVPSRSRESIDHRRAGESSMRLARGASRCSPAPTP